MFVTIWTTTTNFSLFFPIFLKPPASSEAIQHQSIAQSHYLSHPNFSAQLGPLCRSTRFRLIPTCCLARLTPRDLSTPDCEGMTSDIRRPHRQAPSPSVAVPNAALIHTARLFLLGHNTSPSLILLRAAPRTSYPLHISHVYASDSSLSNPPLPRRIARHSDTTRSSFP